MSVKQHKLQILCIFQSMLFIQNYNKSRQIEHSNIASPLIESKKRALFSEEDVENYITDIWGDLEPSFNRHNLFDNIAWACKE
jgi:hypothetical protein